MRIIDTHCHYNLEPLYSGKKDYFRIEDGDPLLDNSWRNHWQKAQENGVLASLVVGANLESSEKALEISQKTKGLFAVLGIHPEEAKTFQSEEELNQAIVKLKNLAKNKEVKAIGETGLDYFRIENRHTDEFQKIQDIQRKLFIAQIQLAQSLNLPLVIHLRDQQEQAYFDCLDILAKEALPEQAIIFHCASGPIAFIKKALQVRRSYFGFDGNLTFKNALELRNIFKMIEERSPEKILIETDAPYLAPIPFRGQVCEPWMISKIAEFIEEELQFETEKIYQNSLVAFGLADTLG